jgi:hypothetical protein
MRTLRYCLQLLRLDNKFILTGVLKERILFGIVKPQNLRSEAARYTSWFEVSARQSSTHYTLDGYDDVLDTVVQQNIWLTEVITTVILGSYDQPATFHILDSVRESEALDQVEKFRDWERVQSRASELI